jgi:hypothetical protein
MRQTSIQSIAGALLLSLGTMSSQAQYLFKDNADAVSNGLGSYTQNFNTLAGTKNLFVSNTTLVGVYARHSLDNVPNSDYESYTRGGTLAKLAPDDGSEGPRTTASVDADGTPHGASWYHFGPATGPDANDRALGGIAATNTEPGKGYVGIRLKNSSTKTIVNLEVQYAMEQWYNSSRTQAADVTVDYRKSTTAITSPIGGGTWTTVSELGVPAPSTSTAIAPRNGNAATNRRVKQTTIMGLNLAAGQEVMIRFGYVFDSGSNGNGLSVDDIVITPQTNVFYSSTDLSKSLSNRNFWSTSADGSGAKPNNFTADNTTYYVQGTANGTDRINGNGTWTISGVNSKIVVGTVGTTIAGAATGTPATLYVGANNQIQGKVEVSAGSTLQIEQSTNTVLLGVLHPTSTVEYMNSGTTVQNVAGASYGTLKLSGTGPKSLTGAVLLNAGLAFNTTGTSALSLNDYDLLLLKNATLTGLDGANTVLVTNGKGALRQTVSNTGTVLFPVGTSATSYSPVTLSQTQAQSEDTYSVRVAPNTFTSYNAAGTGTGAVVAYKNVQKTWFVDEEVVGNSNITMGLQWNAADAATTFQNAGAHINHYVGGAWDKYSATVGASAGTTTGSFTVSRPGIISFSPFSVSSRADGALPVELTAFVARRTDAAVLCTWTTASEKNSRSFVVERSADGRSFEPLGTVAAAGTSSSARTYTFSDERPLAIRAYYRLRQIDLDETERFSPVVQVAEAATMAQPVAVPNPSTGRFEVLMTNGQHLEGPAVVRNGLGAEVLRLTLRGNESADAFDLSNQPAGIYLVQVETSAGVRSLRVVKQ